MRTEEQILYHIKLHLDKTAAEFFRTLPERDRTDFDNAVAALGERYKPLDIEELNFTINLKVMSRWNNLVSLEQLGRKASMQGIRPIAEREVLSGAWCQVAT